MRGEQEEMAGAHGHLLGLINRIQGQPVGSTVPSPGRVRVYDAQDYAALLSDFMGLHASEPQPRGYAFEAFLRKIFNFHGLLARGGFRTTGEQIDGSFHMLGETYLFEAKWPNAQTPAADLFTFRGKLGQRTTWARGLFVSYSGFTSDGLAAYGRGGNIVCMDGLDLHDAFHGQIPLDHVLEEKVRRSVETGEVLARVRDLFPPKR